MSDNKRDDFKAVLERILTVTRMAFFGQKHLRS